MCVCVCVKQKLQLYTYRADESLLAGMRADVSLELVGASEALAAEQPVAEERTLASVPAQMSLATPRHTTPRARLKIFISPEIICPR